MDKMQSTEACVESACGVEQENGVDREGDYFLQFSFMLAQTHKHLEVVWKALDLYSNATLDQGPK
jgi:hypothetical protein